MRDDQASDERLIKELDRMYLRIADLESPQAPAQKNPDDYDQDSDQEIKAHEKVIPFPLRRIHVTSREAPEGERKRKRKPWLRFYLIVPIPVIFLLCACLIFFTQSIIGPLNSEKAKTQQQTFSMSAEALAPAQTEGSDQGIENREQEVEMQIDQTTRPVISSTRKSHYTVQVGAFENWEITCNLLEELRDKGLECRWVGIKTGNGGHLYRVFSGSFDNRNEANEFIRKRGIFNDYPGSFVREILSKEGQRGFPPKANRED